MAKCRTCGAEIVWKKTAAGRNVPLDPPEKRYVENTTSIHRGQVEMRDTWLSHFATCPQADEHRKGKPLPGSTEDYLGGNDG